METLKLLIAEDHQIMIDGIRSMLEGEENYAIIGEANNGQEALEQLQKGKVDVIIADMNMPVMTGLELTRKVNELYPEIHVLVLTMYNDKEIITEVINAGAAGYILKNTGKAEFLTAIDTVSKGNTYFSNEVTNTMLQSIKQTAKKEKEETPEANLTKREIEILSLIAKEFSSAEIAEELFISQRTVETHRKHIIKKVGVKNVAGLVKYAIDHNLI